MTIGLLLLAVAAGLLLAGAELFAEHAASAGRALGVTGLAVGVLLAGAEPEEMLTAITAAARGHPGIAVGDAIGANITMLTLALGLAALIRPVPVGGRVRTYAFAAAATGGLAALALANGRLSRPEGLGLITVYVVLVAAVWRHEKQPPVIGELAETLEEDDEPDADTEPTALGLALVLAGIAVMAVGGVFAVQGAVRIVDALDVTDTAVGLTLVALATTAELLALAWAAARRDISELAVAAIVGSAAYNATATLGAAALVHPADDINLRLAAVAAAVLPFVTLALGGRHGHVGRAGGVVLVAVYAGFVVTVFR